jgi:hypothetical protein
VIALWVAVGVLTALLVGTWGYLAALRADNAATWRMAWDTKAELRKVKHALEDEDVSLAERVGDLERAASPCASCGGSGLIDGAPEYDVSGEPCGGRRSCEACRSHRRPPFARGRRR